VAHDKSGQTTESNGHVALVGHYNAVNAHSPPGQVTEPTEHF